MRKYSCLLPKAKRRDSHIQRSGQTVFGGLAHSLSAGAHEITQMSGLSAMTYPAIGTMEKRFRYDVSAISGNPHGLCLHDRPVMAKGTGLYTVSEEGTLSLMAKVTDTDKTLVSFGPYLFVLPDRMVCNTEDGSIRSLSANTGVLSEASLGSNYVTYSTADWEQLGFAVGDGVAIHVKNYILGSTTVFYRKVTGMTKGTLFLDSEFERTGTFDITVTLDIPELTRLCALGDRLMGCHGNTVYLSEAGNPFNWTVKKGEDGDPVTLHTAGAGEITACAAYQGNGLCFKEDRVYQLMGNHAPDYMLTVMTAPGVSSDSARSLCEVGGALYYLAPGGVYRFDGDHPTPVGQALSQELTGGVGGTDGVCYYLTAWDPDGVSRMYTYRADLGMWFVQDLLAAHAMVTQGDLLFIQTITGELLRNTRRNEALPKDQTNITETASVIPSQVIFGDAFGETPDGLRLHGVHLRASGAENAVLMVEVSYDGGPWKTVKTISGAIDGMLHLPVYPRRAESYRLRLTMTGQWTISEIVCDHEGGKQ